MKYKYNLNHYIDNQPRTITVASIEKILSAEHGISRSTFLRDRSITADSDQSIPVDRLDVYAALLSVSVDQLKNYTTKKVKPLTEREPSPDMKKIIKKTGLKR
jgi:hypothetical protein